MNLRDFIATTPAPELPAIRYAPPPLTRHDLAMRELGREGAAIWVGNRAAGFREHRVTRDWTQQDPTLISFVLLPMPLRWEGDDS